MQKRLKTLRKITAPILVLIIVLSPIVPTIKMPKGDEPIKLGVEVTRAHADPYANGYNYRRSITINASEVTGSGNLTDFPVLISFTDPTFETIGNGGNVTDTEGDDIIFTSDSAGSTVLDFERERYTPTTGEVIYWVEVPTLDFDDNTVIYMFYGNSGVTSTQEDITGVWDGNYEGVWHLHETSGQHLDSTSNNNDSTTVTVSSQGGANGKFSKADDFDGTDDVVSIPDSATLDLVNAGTIEAWMRTDNIDTWESNFSTWVSRNAPNGAGINDQSGIDSVIVGENIHYGAYLCTGGTNDFAVATSSLSGNRFDNWDLSKMSATTGCGDNEGGAVAMDSDGVHIYYGALGWSGATAAFQTATATPTYSAVSTWRNDADPTGVGADEGSGIGMVIVGNTAYYDTAMLTTAVDKFASTSRTLGSGATIVWNNGVNDTGPVGGGANESCANAIESDGSHLYRVVYCHNGATVSYWLASTTLSATAPPTWLTQTAVPATAAANEYDGIDMTVMGGRLLHVASLHVTSTEHYRNASSSMAAGGALAWTSIKDGSNNPDGTAALAGDSQPITVASDGKNVYYGAFIASSTSERFYTASSTLPAHPFISKFGAYEAIQVGTGFAFDWAGRPYTFGTSTNTTSFKHITITQDGTTLNMYENGVLKRTQTTSVDFESNANALLIGGGNRSDGTAIYFNGIVDEVRVSSTARSTDWIQTQYNNQNATSTFYTLGSEQIFSTTPTVTTNFASNVGASSATLHGTIMSNGGNGVTEHGFAHSTDSALISSVSTSTLGAYSGAGNFSAPITSLTADTTYYFRAYATNPTDTGYGTISSFFTGNSTVSKTLQLFEGATFKLFEGKMILYPR